MFLKSLKIFNQEGLIRNIVFHPGFNLIVDETPINFLTKTNDIPKNKTGNSEITTGNNVGKTSVLKLINFCLGGDAKDIYTDPENKKNEYSLVKEFLINTHVRVCLTLIPCFDAKNSEVLSPFTKDEEYETLYLFLLGCDFNKGDEKQNIISSIKLETSFKKRLEAKQTYSTYKSELSLIEKDILNLQSNKSLLWINPDFEKDLQQLNEVNNKIENYNSKISQLMLRKELVTEAIENINSNSANIDFTELNSLYSEVKHHFSGIQKTFEDLVNFHNKMIEEKSRYIAKDLPILNKELSDYNNLVSKLIENKKQLKKKLFFNYIRRALWRAICIKIRYYNK